MKPICKLLLFSIPLFILMEVITIGTMKGKGAFRSFDDDSSNYDIPIDRKHNLSNIMQVQEKQDEVVSMGEIMIKWKGDVSGGEPHSFKRIYLVISHCNETLDWMENFISGFPIYNTTIISKCNATINSTGITKESTVIKLPNVGRCDYNNAWWLARHNSEVNNDDAIIFLKANNDIHQAASARSLSEMMRIASVDGFGCWLKLKKGMSAYHDTMTLLTFGKKRHVRFERDRTTEFRSNYSNFGEWMGHVKATLPFPVTQVCYGGSFVVKGSRVKSIDASFWKNLEDSLSRGDNIEEGHFVERLWAGLLANPLTEGESTLIQQISKVWTFMRVQKKSPYVGVLVNRKQPGA